MLNLSVSVGHVTGRYGIGVCLSSASRIGCRQSPGGRTGAGPLQIAIHLGAHCTDEDLILRTLADNGDTLGPLGVRVPPGGKARPAIRQALRGKGGDLVPGLGHPRLRALLDDAPAERIVLSYEGFLGTYAEVLSAEGIYADAGARTAAIRQAFAGHEVAFFLAVRNPATFVPAIFARSSATDFPAFAAAGDLGRIAWSEPVARIRDACPEVPLTVWCNEDLPLVWPDVLRRIAGVDGDLDGGTEVLSRMLTRRGTRRLEARLATDPPSGDAAWRALVTELLDSCADEAAVAPDIALPGWSEEMIAGLSARYEADVRRLAAMNSIAFLAP